jgi:hypothetical protein
MTFDHLPLIVANCLKAYYRRKRAFHLLRVVLAAAIVYGVLSLAAMHLDRFLFLETAFRQRMFWTVHLATGLFGAACLLVFCLRRSSVRQIAYEFESRLPVDAEERFVTLDDVLARGEFKRSPVAVELAAELEKATIECSWPLHAGRLVEDRPLRRLVWACVGLLTVLTLLSLPKRYELPLMLERFYFPGRNLPKPSFVKIAVTPERIRVGKGGEAVIQAEITGEVPPVVLWLMKQFGVSSSRCVIAFRDGVGGRLEFDEAAKADMSRLLRNVFLYSRGSLEESFSYQIRCGDAQTHVLFAEVIAQPRIVDARLAVTPPAYTGLPEQTITDVQRPVSLLQGTKVVVSFRTDQAVPVRTIEFEKVKEPVEPDWDETTRTGTYEFELKKKASFEIRVVNALGFANVERVKVVIGLLEDAGPVVRLDDPTSDLEKVPGELVPVQAAIEDDFGVSEVVMQFVMNPSADSESPLRDLPVPLERSGERKVAVSTFLDLNKTAAVPGDVVALQVRAKDTAGNYTESREVLIRVISFTRGENERLRLAALRFLSAALGEVAQSAKPAGAESRTNAFDIDKDHGQKIAELAKKIGLELPENPSVETLLDFLEKEHHFTDAPRHKEDVQFLYLAIRSACAPFARTEYEDLYAGRAQTLKWLVEEVLPGLTAFRQVKNITWRLFGMRYEAWKIGKMLGELSGAAADEESDKTRAITRRAELYFQTLQDIGDELITLSRASDALDEKKVEELVGQANTEAFYMRRGSLKKRQACTDNVAGLIVQVLTEIQSSYPALLDKEGEARRKLQDVYRKGLTRLSAGPPIGAEGGEAIRKANALPWLETDARLMDFRPYLPVWQRLTGFVLFEAATGKQSPLRASNVLEPDKQTATAVGNERVLADALAFAWEANQVLAIEEISGAEKRLELALLGMEWAARHGGESQSELAKRIAAMGPADELSIVEIAALRGKIPPSALPDATADAVTAILAESGMKLLSSEPAETDLKATIGAFQGFGDLVKGTLDAIKGGQTELPGSRAAEIVARLQGGSTDIKRLASRLFLEMSLRPSVEDESARNEILLLKLREAVERHESRVSPILESLATAAGAPLGARELTTLGSDLDRLVFLLNTTKSVLEKIAAAHAEKTPLTEDEARKYVILSEFTRTRRYLHAAQALMSLSRRRDAPPPDPAAPKTERELALQFVRDFPEAGLTYLKANTGSASDALKALLKAGALLQASASNAQAFDREIAQGRRALESLRAIIAESGAGETQERLGGSVGQVLARIDRLGFDEKKPAAAEIQRKLYDLGETVKELGRLVRDLKDLNEANDENATAFRGGPEGIWQKEYRAQAEKSRERLLGQVRSARRDLILGVLEGLNAQPDRRRYQSAYQSAVFLYRLVRSDLAGVGGVRPPGSGKDKEGDPHLKFLKEELEKAKQVKNLKNYAEPTKEYLDSVGDFLRY